MNSISIAGAKEMQSSVSFTLPICCQICLGKVKEPVTCSNQHVFCSICMNAWLDRNSRCPTCRVEITSQSPLRKIIGGFLQNDKEKEKCRETARELRRTRFELVLKEYEEEILHLQNESDSLHKENKSLKNQVENFQPENFSDVLHSSKTLEVYPQSCSRCRNVKDFEEMLVLTKKLQEATSTFSEMKEKLARMKKINEDLVKKNDDLERENQKIRQEFHTRSPMKYSRLTVLALESRLESTLKEVEQLKRAMERNDAYTENLEQELKSYKVEIGKFSCIQKLKTEPDLKFPVTSVLDPSREFLSPTCDLVFPNSNDQEKIPLEINDLPSSVTYDETSKASSFFELQGFDDSFTNLTDTVDSALRTSFSRKLEFDQTDGNIASTSQEADSFLPINTINNPNLNQTVIKDSADADSNPISSLQVIDHRTTSPWLHPTATKTIINAGGSQITMSQMKAEDQDAFIRPSSAPSRTFLLSGARFSALKPLDPPSDDYSFQPVKCISPMHMTGSSHHSSSDNERRATSPVLQSISPDDVIDPKYRKNEGCKLDDEVRGREMLSRVTILKRKNIPKISAHASFPPASPLSEGRRKQKLYQKRGVDIIFQSPLKSPKINRK